MPEQPLEDDLDRLGPAQHALHAGAAPAGPEDDEVADRGLPGALAVHDERHAALEERVAHEELAPAGQLTDDELHLELGG